MVRGDLLVLALAWASHGDTMGPLRLLILQATPFCNLACTYCYLPDKSIKKRMPLQVIEASLQKIIAAGLIDEEFSVVWHAGEPLAAGTRFYREADALIRKTLPDGIRFKHCIQTNGTLIDDAWCELFKELNVQLGVSVDGPAFINDKFRVDRKGEGSLARVLSGIDCLKRHDISFHTISVITKDAVQEPEPIFHFLRGLGAESIAFNVEEIEGVHASSSLSLVAEEEFGHFMRRMHELSFASGDPNYVRELRQAHLAVVGSLMQMPHTLTMETNPLAIINVDINGNFSSFSPELLGMKHEAYGDFILGNFLESGIEELKLSPKFKRMTDAIIEGVKKCEASCPYFHFCGGGAPSNKLFENGSFDSAETMHCRMNKKVLTDIVLARMEQMVAHEVPEDLAAMLL